MSSLGVTPAARTWPSTSPGPGCGLGTSSSTSAGPSAPATNRMLLMNDLPSVWYSTRMITRREFAKSLGGVAVVAAVGPVLADEPQVPSAAAKLYRKAFVLDCNTIASIGQQVDSPATMKIVRESGISALKSTLGGANGSFEDAVADIAAAERLIDTAPELFLKVRTAADFDRARDEHKVAVIY